MSELIKERNEIAKTIFLKGDKHAFTAVSEANKLMAEMYGEDRNNEDAAADTQALAPAERPTDSPKPKDNRPVTERVRTFQDALDELGSAHPLWIEYRDIVAAKEGAVSTDLIAYLKLRIITAALNEGWEPRFTPGEYRYYPWFWLYTKDEWAELDEEDKENGVFFGGDADNGAYCGFLYAYAIGAPSRAHAFIGSRLCFETRAKAECAAKRFAQLYFDYYMFVPDADGSNKLKVQPQNKE